ncbi:hypothetical protein ACJZ2D_012591 [Fusarium nematophilum]
MAQGQDTFDSLEAQGHLELLEETGRSVAPPAPTTAPTTTVPPSNQKRQDSSSCGYYLWSNEGTVTPDLSGYPYCWTGITSASDGEITAYVCANAQSAFSIYETTKDAPVIPSGGSLRPAVSEGLTATGYETASGDPTGATSLSTERATELSTGLSASPATSDPNSSLSPKTPVGAIFGGVIGGVALILLAAFALWYIRSQKQKAKAAEGQGFVQPTAAGPEPRAFQPATSGYSELPAKPGSSLPAELPSNGP